MGNSFDSFRYWRQCPKPIGVPLSEVVFFKSPVGMDMLRRLLVAAHITVTLRGTECVKYANSWN